MTATPPQADFYILKSSNATSRYLPLCRLLIKAWPRHRIYIHCQDLGQVSYLDDFIWHCLPDSFLPHSRLGHAPTAPIELGLGQPAPQHRDMLVNLAIAPPHYHPEFNRIIEFVAQDKQILQATRAHYQLYRKQGRKLQRHTL
jgi:DNA polymerase IIIc chi subunit